MSFSKNLKNEAARINLASSKLLLSELSGFIRTCGEIKFIDQEIILEFVTENASIARRIFTFLKSYTSDIEAYKQKTNQLNRNNHYLIVMKDKYAIDDLLYDTGFIKNEEYQIRQYKVPDYIVKTEEEIRAYLRACFLGGGSITNPEKSYHLEFVGKTQEFAEDIKEKLNKKSLNGKISNRKSSFIVYLKEAEQISNFMALIGVNQSLLNYENIRIVKELRNNVNRVVNCETANINKTISASMKQIEDIKYLIEIEKFEDLSQDIREVGMLRLENEDASLNDISQISNNKYSRSGINYRLKKISKTAEKFRGANDERNES